MLRASEKDLPVTILKALEVCYVLVKPSKRIVKFKQLRRKKGRWRRTAAVQTAWKEVFSQKNWKFE
jgi:hypothetical protein